DRSANLLPYCGHRDSRSKLVPHQCRRHSLLPESFDQKTEHPFITAAPIASVYEYKQWRVIRFFSRKPIYRTALWHVILETLPFHLISQYFATSGVVLVQKSTFRVSAFQVVIKFIQ